MGRWENKEDNGSLEDQEMMSPLADRDGLESLDRADFNELDGSETDLDDQELLEERLKRRRRHRLFALLILICFLAMIFAGLLRGLSAFPLGTYLESRKLIRDPDIAELRESVVYLSAFEEEGDPSRFFSRRHTGTGFNIDGAGKIITNLHVIDERDTISVSFMDARDEWHQIDRIVRPTHPNIDMAIIYLKQAEDNDNSGLPYVTIADQDDIQVSEEVKIIGNPRGISGLVVTGKISHVTELPVAPYRILEIHADIQPGHSGSPVFNEEGNVIGLIYAARINDQGERVGLAFPIKELLEDKENYFEEGRL